MATTTTPTTKNETDVQPLLDALHAEAKAKVPGYTLVAPRDGVPYERITNSKRTVCYVTPQKHGLRLDLPLPAGKYQGVKVTTLAAVPKAVQAVLANAAKTEPKPKAKPAAKKPAPAKKPTAKKPTAPKA
jgi:hypothetical protein